MLKVSVGACSLALCAFNVQILYHDIIDERYATDSYGYKITDKSGKYVKESNSRWSTLEHITGGAMIGAAGLKSLDFVRQGIKDLCATPQSIERKCAANKKVLAALERLMPKPSLDDAHELVAVDSPVLLTDVIAREQSDV